MSGISRIRARRWNLFARELEDLLRAHGHRLGHISTRTNINPTKVLRLRESLSQRNPKCFPLLPQDEIDEIVAAFELTPIEHRRLQASVLVTAMERVLVNRLDPDNALLAAEQLFPAIMAALRQHGCETQGLGLFVGEPCQRPPASSEPDERGTSGNGSSSCPSERPSKRA